MREDQALAASVNTALEAAGLHYTPGAIEVRHLLEIVFNESGSTRSTRRSPGPSAG